MGAYCPGGSRHGYFDPHKETEDYWGNMVAVAADDGFVYVYCHTSEIDEGIRPGVRAEAGQSIGLKVDDRVRENDTVYNES